MKLTATALAALLLLSFSFGQTREKPPTVKEIRATIQRMLTTPAKATDIDVVDVMRFAELSDACMIEATKGLIPNIAQTKEFRMLLGYYVAGAVQFDLDHPKLMKDSAADKEAAVKAQLLIYREIQKVKKSYKDSVLENLSKLEEDGKLRDHIKKVVAEAAKQK